MTETYSFNYGGVKEYLEVWDSNNAPYKRRTYWGQDEKSVSAYDRFNSQLQYVRSDFPDVPLESLDISLCRKIVVKLTPSDSSGVE